MTDHLRGVVLVGLLLVAGACSETRPITAPTALPAADPLPAPVPPTPPRTFPPLAGPATTYVFSGPLSYPVSEFTVTSKFVLYGNGAFALVYTNGQLSGVYEQAGEEIVLWFQSGGEPASARLRGRLLEIQFSERMQHSDFENAVYQRAD